MEKGQKLTDTVDDAVDYYNLGLSSRKKLWTNAKKPWNLFCHLCVFCVLVSLPVTVNKFGNSNVVHSECAWVGGQRERQKSVAVLKFGLPWQWCRTAGHERFKETRASAESISSLGSSQFLCTWQIKHLICVDCCTHWECLSIIYPFGDDAVFCCRCLLFLQLLSKLSCWCAYRRVPTTLVE